MICKVLLIIAISLCFTNAEPEASDKNVVHFPPESYYSSDLDEGPIRGDLGGKRRKRNVINFPPSSYYSESDDEGPVRGDLGSKRRKRDISGRIVGGAAADITQFPYQISLTYFNYYTEQREHICGGTIISEKIILTAAHCSYNFPMAVTSTYQVRVGSSSSLEGGQLIEVEKIINHDDYNSISLANDISILVLKEPIKFSDKANKIPISTKNRVPGAQAIVSGWGFLYENSGIPSPQLNFVNVPVIDSDECQSKYYSDEVLAPSMMCAGYPNGKQDSCTTDSGGPLVQGGEIIGVVSWGAGCARENRPGVYTNVFYMSDWIKTQINLYSV